MRRGNDRPSGMQEDQVGQQSSASGPGTTAGAAATGARGTAGQETEQVRFSEKAVESPDGAAKQVCEGFVQWSERARIARMVVHFSF